MHVWPDVPPLPAIRPGNPFSAPDTSFVGFLQDLREAFPGKVSPVHVRGAMQGEGVTSRFREGGDDNYLYSLNAQTCVIATLYNLRNQAGAVIHFDHNITSLVDEAVTTALESLGHHELGDIQATLSGGVWFMGGERIGDPVKNALSRADINASWDQWSFAPCLEHNYGVVLDLASGKVTAFEHSLDLVRQFQTVLLREASEGGEASGGAEHRRASAFMARFMAPAIVQKGNNFHFVGDTVGRAVTRQDIGRFGIPIHEVD